jgi:hypothetical protein
MRKHRLYLSICLFGGVAFVLLVMLVLSTVRNALKDKDLLGDDLIQHRVARISMAACCSAQSRACPPVDAVGMVPGGTVEGADTKNAFGIPIRPRV